MVDLCLDGHILEGRGHTFADAILDLAAGIKDARAQQGEGILAKALKQPTGSWPNVMPKHPADGGVVATQKPSVGRIVWYYPDRGEIEGHKDGPLPAFVTRVVDGLNVNLQVILDGQGSRFVPGVDYGGDKTLIPAGTWLWPTKI